MFRRTRWLAVAFAAAVVAASLLPSDGGATAATLLGVGADKWLHAAGYAVLAALVDADHGPWPVVVAAVALLGVGVELLQWPLATRDANALDAAANTVGAAAGVGLRRLARAARSRRGD